MRLSRRNLLQSTVYTLLLTGISKSAARAERPAWRPFDGSPPDFRETIGAFLTADERAILGAIVDRLIPGDTLSVSGTEAGCVDYIDLQLAGGYGIFSGQYRQGPFQQGTPTQGDQSALTPRERYRIGLAALDAYCQQTDKAAFASLTDDRRDAILRDLEADKIALDGISTSLFFEQVLGDAMDGFFADPIYGGNREMVSWKMLGFPGARYDYSQYVNIGNKPVKLEPVSMKGGPSWVVRG